jgi:hypothetical protein
MRRLREANNPLSLCSKDDEALPILRHAVLCGGHNAMVDAITELPKCASCFRQDRTICDRSQVGHVLQQECSGSKFANNSDKVPNQIGTIVACTLPFSGYRKRLAGWTTDNEVRVLEICTFK